MKPVQLSGASSLWGAFLLLRLGRAHLGIQLYGIAASTGTVGDSYNNALAENVNGSYKNELIHRRTWADVLDVEIATFEWVNWWNESRLHQSLGYRTPAEVEAEFWEHHPSRETMEIKAQA
ncbi:integrase core domain-containing protein [Corynebacterium pseudodiphtheriticum]|uniref:integrase core domain-containing protein n=1 Tax=Corynebacterium pseudodiphtheriticum TaxID=37637 RepID=UPI003F574149